MTAKTTCAFKNPATGKRDCPNARWKDGASYCGAHEDAYRSMRKFGQSPRSRGASVPKLSSADASDERVTDAQAARSHQYVPDPDLVAVWAASVASVTAGEPAGNFLFTGPSGSGKTDGARHLAALAGVDFTKVDAASMVDPEAWFGTREIVVQDGVAITEYHPSDFVEALGRPGLILIDEANRVRDEHRNVLIPVLDHTRAVLNPLTGTVVARHPQCFIAMACNVGLNYTGVNAMDPAFVKRARHWEFNYLSVDAETKVIVDATGVDEDTAYVFARLGADTRAKAANDDEFLPVSTREVIDAARLVRHGLSRDLAFKTSILLGVSAEGGSASARQELQVIWNGVRAVRPAVQSGTASAPAWKCPIHGTSKYVPSGTSAKTGRPYTAFWGCGTFGCPNTSDNVQAPASAQAAAGNVVICPDCNTPQAAGRLTYCTHCGATLS